MIPVYRSPDAGLVSLRQSVLEDAGIPTFIRNSDTEQLPVAGLATAIAPIPQFYPTLCVLGDEDFPAAMEILRLAHASPGELADWICLQCRETVPGNFDSCWHCQAPRQPGEEALARADA